MSETCIELTSRDGFFRFQFLNKPRFLLPGAHVFTTIKAISPFTFLSLIEFEIADTLHFEVGK